MLLNFSKVILFSFSLELYCPYWRLWHLWQPHSKSLSYSEGNLKKKRGSSTRQCFPSLSLEVRRNCCRCGSQDRLRTWHTFTVSERCPCSGLLWVILGWRGLRRWVPTPACFPRYRALWLDVISQLQSFDAGWENLVVPRNRQRYRLRRHFPRHQWPLGFIFAAARTRSQKGKD